MVETSNLPELFHHQQQINYSPNKIIISYISILIFLSIYIKTYRFGVLKLEFIEVKLVKIARSNKFHLIKMTKTRFIQ